MRYHPTLSLIRRWTAVGVCVAALAVMGCGDSDGGTAGGTDSAGGGDGGASADVGAADTLAGVDAGEDTADAAPDSGAGQDTGAAADTDVATDAGGTDVAAATLVPSLVADPLTYTFSYIAPLTTGLTKQITLTNGGGAPLDITAIVWAAGSSGDYDILLRPTLPKTLAPGKQVIMSVRFRDLVGGTGLLDVTSSDPDTPVTRLIFESYKKADNTPPGPCGELVPNALNFGAVARGTSKTLSAEIRNCSDQATLTISAVTRSQVIFLGALTQEFQLANLPATPFDVAPGGSMQVDVVYTPTLAGPDGGHFAFAINDPNEPKLFLDVSALGTSPPIEDIGLHIRIEWDVDETDVDSHLLNPQGSFFQCPDDCYFGNPSPDWGVQGDIIDDPFLDVDDVDGFGPENINISEPQAGTYTFIVHYYDDAGPSGFGIASATSVEVRSYGQLIGSFGPQSLASTNQNWDVFTIDWPSAVVTELGQVYAATPTASNQFCGIPGFP